MTTSFHISNVFERKLHYYRLLKDMTMNNLSHISTVKFTELKVSRQYKPTMYWNFLVGQNHFSLKMVYNMSVVGSEYSFNIMPI